MVILKMQFPKLFRGRLFVVLKEFYKIGGVLKAQLVGYFVDMVVRIEEETAGFPDDVPVQHFTGALTYRLAAGCIEILRGAAQLPGQHAHLSLDSSMGQQKIHIAGVELRLYTRMQECIPALFQQLCDQCFEKAIDAVICIGGRSLRIGGQQGKQIFQVAGFFEVQTVGMPDEGEKLFQRFVPALLEKGVLEYNNVAFRLIVQLPIMDLLTVEEKEYRRLDIVTMTVDPMTPAAPG